MRSLERRRLPIVFRPLDLEGKTKPVPSVACPVRADVMTVGNCGRCIDFRQIDFDEDGRPVLCCTRDGRGKHGDGPHAARVQDVLRVPVICTAPDTALAVILPYLRAGTALDAIPVLDLHARPIGFLTLAEARRLVAAGIALDTTMEEVMGRQIVCALPETRLSDAADLLTETDSKQLFGVAADGTFLGLVTMHDLSADNSWRRNS